MMCGDKWLPLPFERMSVSFLEPESGDNVGPLPGTVLASLRGLRAVRGPRVGKTRCTSSQRLKVT